MAAESSREVKEVQSEAKALLQEIAHNMALPAVRTLAYALRMALRRILHGVYVNTAGLERVCVCISDSSKYQADICTYTA